MQQKFQRSIDELDSIVTMTRTVFEQQGINPELRDVVDLATEELFVNMVEYNTETDAQILIEMNARDDGVEVSLTDYDVHRFDPTAAGQVDVDAPLVERTPGGLGIFLVLKMVDSINYEYRDQSSKITFTVSGK